MELHHLHKDEYTDWDTFLDTSPQATIYGKSWYLNALGSPYEILAVKEKGSIVGGMVLAKNPIGWYGNPLLCKYLGAYFADFAGNAYNAETKRKKVSKLLAEAAKKYRTFGYTFHPNFKNYLPFYLAQFSSKVYYSYWIDVANQAIEEIQAKMYSKLRSEIKYGLKSEYIIEPNIDFDTFYNVNEKTFLRQGGKPPFKRDFLRDYFKKLQAKNALQTFAVKDTDGQIMSVAGLIYDEHATSLVINGFDPEVMKRGANELLIFECIKFAKNHSKYFDFEGSMLEPIDSFYRKFGGAHRPYYKIYKNNVLNFALEKGIYWYKKLKYGK